MHAWGVSTVVFRKISPSWSSIPRATRAQCHGITSARPTRLQHVARSWDKHRAASKSVAMLSSICFFFHGAAEPNHSWRQNRPKINLSPFARKRLTPLFHSTGALPNKRRTQPPHPTCLTLSAALCALRQAVQRKMGSTFGALKRTKALQILQSCATRAGSLQANCAWNFELKAACCASQKDKSMTRHSATRNQGFQRVLGQIFQPLSAMLPSEDQ